MNDRIERVGFMKSEYLSRKGFSLVELIIVIAIMAILAAAIAPALIRYINKSRKASDIETASVIMDSLNVAYGEDYSYEGTENGVQQDADFIGPNIVNVSGTAGEAPYPFEIISVAKDGDTFVNTVQAQQHFLSLFRKSLGKEQNGSKEFSNPKCNADSGLGVPGGFVIGRKLNASNEVVRFEVWICDSNGDPIYRLNPDCCKEYK